MVRLQVWQLGAQVPVIIVGTSRTE